MNLRETGIGKESALFVSAICCRNVAPARIRREIKDISVTPGGQDHGITGNAIDFSGAQVAGNDSLGMPVHHHKVEHLGLGKHLYGAGRDLAAERLITSEQQLLSSL